MRNEYEIVDNVSGVEEPNNDGEIITFKVIPYYGYEDDMVRMSFKEYKKMLKKGEIHIAEDNKDYLVSKYKNGICINKYIGNDKDVVIPNKLEGLPVIKLGVYIEDDIDTGGEHYFEAFDITGLTTIKLPKHLKYIVGRYSFVTTSLEKIEVNSDNKYYTSINGILYSKDKKILLQIPENYNKSIIEVRNGTEVVYCTFLNDKKAKILKIPASVVSFGEHIGKKYTKIFSITAIEGLKSYEVSDDNKYYSSIDGVLYDKSQKTLLSYPAKKSDEKFIVPESVKYISNTNFGYVKKLQTLIIGRQVKKVNMFYYGRETTLTVRGYKNSSAEKAVRKLKKEDFTIGNSLLFESLD